MFKINASIQADSNSTTLKDGLCLWIWHPDKKSPHIGISRMGLYYSLQRSTKQEAVKISKLISTIDRKSTPVLVLRLKSEIFTNQISQEFSRFTSCEADDSSCSKPILNLFGIKKENGLLFDLLDLLNQNKAISSQFHLNISEPFEGIPHYTYEDVKANLVKLAI